MLFDSQPRRSWSDRRILTLLAIGTLIVSVLWRLPSEAQFLGQRLGELLFALVLAMAATYVLRPGVRAFCRVRWIGNSRRGRTLATLMVFLLCGALFYGAALATVRPVTHDLRVLWPDDKQERKALLQNWKASMRGAMEPYRDLLPKAALDDPDFLTDQAALGAQSALAWIKTQGSHVGFIVELLLVPVLAFYFLADGPAIRREVKLLALPAWRPALARMAGHLDFVLDGYVRGQAWMCVIAWAIVTLFLWVLKVPHAVTLGLIAGITRAVPVIGPMLGAVPLLFVCLFTTKSVETTGILLFGFFLMHFLESKVLLPKIVGHHVDLHPVSVIVSLLIGLEFFGFIGIVLAVPFAAVLKIMLVEYHFAQAQKLAIKNGSAMPLPFANGHGAARVEQDESVSKAL